MPNNQINNSGPVFFLFPLSIEQEQVVKLMVYYEIEAYLLRNPLTTFELVKQYRGGTLCINIDATYSDTEWDKYIGRLTDNQDTGPGKIILLAFKSSSSLIDKYCTSEKSSCTFIQLKHKVSPLQEIIAHIEIGSPKDRRKSLRLKYNDTRSAYMQLKLGESRLGARIFDISSAGMVCKFTDDRIFEKGAIFENMEIKGDGISLELHGQVAGHVQSDKGNHVVLFKDVENSWKKKQLGELIYGGLQSQINDTMNSLQKKRAAPVVFR